MTLLKFQADPLGGTALVAQVKYRGGGLRGQLECRLERATAQSQASVTVLFKSNDNYPIETLTIERIQVPSIDQAAELACFIVDRFLAGAVHPMVYAQSWQDS